MGEGGREREIYYLFNIRHNKFCYATEIPQWFKQYKQFNNSSLYEIVWLSVLNALAFSIIFGRVIDDNMVRKE